MKRLKTQFLEQFLLIIGAGIFFLSIALAFFEAEKSSETIIQQAAQNIEADFREYALLPLQDSPEKYPICKLEFIHDTLVSWSNNRFLPSIEDLYKAPQKWGGGEIAVEIGRRIYYIGKRTERQERIGYNLYPLSVNYEIVNNFLPSYNFMGRYSFLSESLDDPMEIGIALTPTDKGAIAIHNLQGKPVFYISNLQDRFIRKSIRTQFLLLGCGGIFLFLVGIYFSLKKSNRFSDGQKFLIFIGITFVLRAIAFYFKLPYSYVELPLFSADTVAFDIWVPSLGDLLLNTFIIYLFAWWGWRVLGFDVIPKIHDRLKHPFLRHILIPGICLLCNTLIIKGLVLLIDRILTNSQLQIDFTNIFQFGSSLFSYALLIGLGTILIIAFLLVGIFSKWDVESYSKLFIPQRFFFLAIRGIFLLIINYYLFAPTLNLVLVSSITLCVWAAIFQFNPRGRILDYNLVTFIFLIISSSLLLSVYIVQFNVQKKENEIDVIAKRTFKDRDNSTYSAYDHAVFRMEQNPDTVADVYNSFKDNPDRFVDWVKQTYFSPHFKDVQLQFFLFSSKGQRLSPSEDNVSSYKQHISQHDVYQSYPYINIGEQAEEIESGFYRTKAYGEIFDEVYIGLFAPTQDIYFQVQIYPTRLDFNNVYPSLLQDNEVRKSTERLQQYDLALYDKDILSKSFGISSFPQQVETRVQGKLIEGQVIKGAQYKDFLYVLDKEKAVIIRTFEPKMSDYVNTLSLVFFFFSIGLLMYLLCGGGLSYLFLRKPFFPFTSLQIQLQGLFIGLIAITLVLIFASLLVTIKDRFSNENQNLLHNEMRNLAESITREYKDLINRPKDSLTQTELATNITNDLFVRMKGLGEKLGIDLNLFDKNGALLCTTQPIIKSSGLSPGLMDFSAFSQLDAGNISELFVKEVIGTAEFVSVYKTLNVGDPHQTIYVNVPYFDRTKEVNQKTTNLLGNITSILLALIVLVAFTSIYVARFLTYPLKLIQQRLTETHLGSKNEPIEYGRKDEIGAIVTAYNNMLDQLLVSEKKLAQNEREVAWTQMAKQVAHEIKNPLTPMKLSIQHIKRAWDDKNANLDRLFPKVTSTLLTQIETLTRIADSFSEFAKMPDAIKTEISLNDCLREVANLFSHNDNNIDFDINIPETPFYMMGDKDQLIRVFTNLVKNATQAIENKTSDAQNPAHKISIKMILSHKQAEITIQDSGCGMSEDIQKRVFEPNFTTKTSGSGLGLAMVKRIVEAHEGTIRFETQENVGSSFMLNFQQSSQRN